MKTITELIQTRALDQEHMVLSQILSTRKMVLDLIPEYFQGANHRLFGDALQQWDEYGEINVEALTETHATAIDRALGYRGDAGKVTLAKLHTAFLSRSEGLILNETLKIDDPLEALRALQEYAGEAVLSRKSEAYDQHKATEEVLGVLEAAAERETSPAANITGFSTGIPKLDNLTNGIEWGNTYVVGALKKTGKSRFMTYLAMQVMKRGAGVLVESQEMDAYRLNLLALSNLSGINSRNLGRTLPPGDHAKLEMATQLLRGLPWVIYRDKTAADIRSRIIYERTKRPIDVVMVDYIQRMRDPSFKNDRPREIERICHDLADMGRELKVAVVILTQLKGEAEKVGKGKGEADKMPDMSHAKESQGIPESADVILTLHNPDRHDNPFQEDGSYRYPTIKCKVEQRYDVSGPVISLTADLSTCNFSEYRV